jgi:hypothetical protein
MKKQHFGICRLCGNYGKLSFEHVPPESAFNDQRILVSSFEQMLTREHPDEFKGRQQQRGAGDYTLCGKCNNDTGHWYVPAFTSWAQQAMRVVIGTRGRPSLEYPFVLDLLRKSIGHAQRAADYLHSLQPQQTEEEEARAVA